MRVCKDLHSILFVVLGGILLHVVVERRRQGCREEVDIGRSPGGRSSTTTGQWRRTRRRDLERVGTLWCLDEVHVVRGACIIMAILTHVSGVMVCQLALEWSPL